MEDVVEKDELGRYIKERIEENETLFTKDEIKAIKSNKSAIRKVYILGFLNAKNCYEI